jgi:hypothetical protein
MVNKETAVPHYPPDISRRSFIKISAAVMVASGLTVLGVNEILGSRENTKDQSLSEVITEIKSKYGIEIPIHEGEYSQYQVCYDQNNDLIHCGEEKNTQISLDEANIIEDSLKSIPSVGKYTQLIIPFREDGPDIIGGGEYLGLNWDYFLDPAKYQNYPKDRYLSNKSVVKLVLSNKYPKEPLPPYTQSSNFLPLFSEVLLNEIGIQAKNRVDYPWTTYGERLKQATIHETGGYGIEEYACRIKIKNNPKAEHDASAMSQFGGIPLDTYSPIPYSFAKVNGWKLVPYGEFIGQWGNYGKEAANELKQDNPKLAVWPVWDRDSDIWGPIEDRNIRLDPCASYGTIKETFATFLMFYVLSRKDNRYDKSLLTEAETKYFDKMFRGLSRNPDSYIYNLIKENPGPIYSPDLFKDKVRSNKSSEQTSIIYPEQVSMLNTSSKKIVNLKEIAKTIL